MSNVTFAREMNVTPIRRMSPVAADARADGSLQPSGVKVGNVTVFLSGGAERTGELAAKAEAAWDVLQAKYASRISEAELDHLFACFVFGLTSPAFGDGEPSAHFEICQDLVALKLPLERAYTALHQVPESSEAGLDEAYRTIERQGIRIGMALMANQTESGRSAAGADAALARAEDLGGAND